MPPLRSTLTLGVREPFRERSPPLLVFLTAASRLPRIQLREDNTGEPSPTRIRTWPRVLDRKWPECLVPHHAHLPAAFPMSGPQGAALGPSERKTPAGGRPSGV